MEMEEGLIRRWADLCEGAVPENGQDSGILSEGGPEFLVFAASKSNGEFLNLYSGSDRKAAEAVFWAVAGEYGSEGGSGAGYDLLAISGSGVGKDGATREIFVPKGDADRVLELAERAAGGSGTEVRSESASDPERLSGAERDFFRMFRTYESELTGVDVVNLFRAAYDMGMNGAETARAAGSSNELRILSHLLGRALRT